MTNENRAFILAPLMMPFAFLSYAFFADIPGFNMQDGFIDYLGSALIIVIIGIPIVYLYEFFIGYRFYRLLLKKNRINIFSLSIGGALIADIPLFMIMPFSWLSSEPGDLLMPLQLFSFVGFMIGLTFWFLLNFDRIRKNTKHRV